MTLEAVRTLDRAGLEVDPTLLFAFVGDEESGEPGSGISAGARAFSALIAREHARSWGVSRRELRNMIVIAHPESWVAPLE
jgi:acetylornithine deacetylase/succinyl-diaminopimelate desuccinylase-like protein